MFFMWWIWRQSYFCVVLAIVSRAGCALCVDLDGGTRRFYVKRGFSSKGTVSFSLKVGAGTVPRALVCSYWFLLAVDIMLGRMLSCCGARLAYSSWSCWDPGGLLNSKTLACLLLIVWCSDSQKGCCFYLMMVIRVTSMVRKSVKLILFLFLFKGKHSKFGSFHDCKGGFCLLVVLAVWKSLSLPHQYVEILVSSLMLFE